MDPREHHFFFAKQMIPMHAFRSTDKMFSELTGPQREAFLMSLWQEAGKSVSSPLPHEDVGRRPGSSTTEMVQLDVAFAASQGGLDVVVISMPPAVAINEAIFIALVRGGGKARVFFYERCRGEDGAASESEAVLAEMNPEGRVDYGTFSGDGLESFREQLGKVLGTSLVGLESSLPPAATAAGAGTPGGGAQATKGKLPNVLERLVFMQVTQPVIVWTTALIRGKAGGIVPLLIKLSFMLSITVVLLIWLYRIYDTRRGRTAYSPGMAVGAWFIPIGNFVLSALIFRDVWAVICGPEGSWMILPCWLLMLGDMGFTAAQIVEMFHISDLSFISTPTMYYLSMAVAMSGYALLWHIIRRINAKA